MELNITKLKKLLSEAEKKYKDIVKDLEKKIKTFDELNKQVIFKIYKE